MLEFLREELDTFQAIYSTDIPIVKELDENDIELTVVPDSAHSYDGSQTGIKIKLTFSDQYPHELPSFEVKARKNLDVPAEKAIIGIIRNILESHQGFEVLFDLHSEIAAFLQEQAAGKEEKESSSDDSSDRGKLADKELVAEDCRATEAEFLQWKAAFRREMIAEGVWKELDGPAISGRPTGRMLFQAMMNKGQPPSEEAQQIFWTDKSLFAEPAPDEIVFTDDEEL